MGQIKGETWVVVPAAGIGQRFSNRRDKLLVHVGGLPMLVRTVERVLNAKLVDGAVVVVHPQNKPLYQRMIHEYGHRKKTIFVDGAQTRRDSVYCGLQALPAEAEWVLVHDAARPLVSSELVDEGVRRLHAGTPALVTAIPMQDTVKYSADGRTVEKTVDRTPLWRAQTPQFFRKDLILKAHQVVDPAFVATDDAQLVELAGLGPVEILLGQERNIKITVPDDLTFAEALLKHPARFPLM